MQRGVTQKHIMTSFGSLDNLCFFDTWFKTNPIFSNSYVIFSTI